MPKKINGLNAEQQHNQALKRAGQASKAIKEHKWDDALVAVKKHAKHLDHAVELEFASTKTMKTDVTTAFNQFKKVRAHFEPDKKDKGSIVEIEKFINDNKIKKAADHLQKAAVKFLKKHGNGEDIDNNFGYHSFFDCYDTDGINEILQLRINAIDNNDIDKSNLKTLEAIYSLDKDGTNAIEIADKVKTFLAQNFETILVPYNIDNQHWVGIIFEKDNEDVVIKYLDSQNNVAPAELVEELLSQFEQARFFLLGVEQQKAGNCGPEVIENFMEYIFGTRIPQDITVIEHSRLIEEHLLGAFTLQELDSIN